MPIVIEDMTVLVEVNQPSHNTGSSQAAPDAGTVAGTGATSQVSEQIRRCVEEVMDVIRQQNER